jgi:DNA-binding response OmpR family regulator
MERSVPPAPARVLLAEDDRSVRDALVMALELEGYEVRATNDGEQALVAFDPFQPDVVILDVMMPGMGGLDATRALRLDPGLARVPVILLTARAQESDIEQGFGAGADDYVVKPFSPRELASRVAAVLARSRA